MSSATTDHPGASARQEGDSPEFIRLRADRHRTGLRVLETLQLDALVVGRESNVQYLSGARRFWTEGARPFGPSCVMIAGSGRVHLLSTWSDGVPAEIGHDQLFGMTWNGAILAGELAAIPGLADSRRIGVDAMTPGVARLLEAVAPHADLVDASAALMEARRVKTPDELSCIRAAVTSAESALDYGLAGLRPDVGGRELTGRVAARLADLGVTNSDLEARFTSASPGNGADSDPLLRAGELITCQVGALYAGYEGEVVRTWINGGPDGRPVAPTAAQRRLGRRGSALIEALMEACRPGGSGSDLLSVYEEADEPLPSLPVAHGVGLGMEPPLIGSGFPADAGASSQFEPGMVLFVLGQVSDPEVGTVMAGETVLITDAGHERLGGQDLGLLFDGS
jgi:Xaa-Pro dipeptidase